MGPALSLIADVVNHDPAPPGLLQHTLASGVAEMALRACTDPDLHFTADLLQSVSRYPLCREGPLLGLSLTLPPTPDPRPPTPVSTAWCRPSASPARASTC